MKLGLMVHPTEEITIRVKKKVKVYSNGQMVLIMKENFLIIPYMVLGNIIKFNI